MNKIDIFQQSLNVSRIIMVVTILMAIISVVFSALTLAFQRSHNRKSIKPYCYIKKTVKDGLLVYTVKNAGLGPMIINTMGITLNGELSEIFDKIVLSPNEQYVLFETPVKKKEPELSISIRYQDIYGRKSELVY